MASAYKRDDKQFREHIARLADAGLNLDRTPSQLTIRGVPVGTNPYHVETVFKGFGHPVKPKRSKFAELICGFVAYAALAIVIALSIWYIILPLWRAL